MFSFHRNICSDNGGLKAAFRAYRQLQEGDPLRGTHIFQVSELNFFRSLETLPLLLFFVFVLLIRGLFKILKSSLALIAPISSDQGFIIICTSFLKAAHIIDLFSPPLDCWDREPEEHYGPTLNNKDYSCNISFPWFSFLWGGEPCDIKQDKGWVEQKSDKIHQRKWRDGAKGAFYGT